MSTANKFIAHFRSARSELGLTQEGLGQALMLSRNYIAQIETGKREPSIRVCSALDALVDKKRAQSTSPQSKSSSLTGEVISPQNAVRAKDHGVVSRQEGRSLHSGPLNSRMVASRMHTPPGAPSARADCELYLAELLDAAERSGNPNAFPVIHDRLKKKFPIAEWSDDLAPEMKA